MNELEGILAALLDGTLDAAGRKRLTEILREDPAARLLYLDYCQMHALLTSAHGVLHALEAPRSRRPRLAAAAGLLLAAGVLFALWRQHRADRLDAALLPGGGVAWVERDGERQELSAGRGLKVGDRLRTGVGAVSELRYPDGTRLRLLDETEVRVLPGGERPRLELREGAIHAQVTPRPAGQPLVLTTPHGDAAVLGTSFDLSASWNETRLRTLTGRMTLSAGGRTIPVGPGELGTADSKGLLRWTSVCDLDFEAAPKLPPLMEIMHGLSEPLLTPARTLEAAADKVHFAPEGFVLGPAPGVAYRHGLLVARWKEEVGDDVVIEAEVAAGRRWSLGFSFSGDSFEGFRAIFAVPPGGPEGISLDTIQPKQHVLLAHDPRPIDFDTSHLLRLESRGRRVRVWVDRTLRIDTELAHPLPEGRRRTFSISNFGAPPVIRKLRVWRLESP